MLRLALSLNPQGPGQVAAQREMLAAVQAALDARRQRIILSRSSINRVKWSVIILQAAPTLVAIAMIHSENRSATKIIMGIFTTRVGIAMLLLAAHTRPFSADVAVTPSACCR